MPMVTAIFAAIMLSGNAAYGMDRANIILILADDLGIQHLRQAETPAIDRIADAGLSFSNAYAGSSLCAPSRAALLLGANTGKVEPRGNRMMRLDPAETTLAELVRASGYRTGLFGKWGFGYDDQPETWPDHHGWDEYVAYLHHVDAQDHTPPFLWQNGHRIELSGEYAQDLFDAAALDFIERHQDEPFLLYVPSALPHEPSKRPGGTGSDAARLATMIARLDTTVGAIVGKLEELGLEKSSLVLVMSDNGAVVDRVLRGEKGSLYEGGLRVPLIAWWPGTIEPGISDRLTASWDIYATAARLAGVDLPGDGHWPLLRDASGRSLYWELHDVTTMQAVRWGAWKAVRHAPNEPIELYDLAADPFETDDVAEIYQTEVKQAQQIMAQRSEHPDWPLVESDMITDLIEAKEYVGATLREWSAEVAEVIRSIR